MTLPRLDHAIEDRLINYGFWGSPVLENWFTEVQSIVAALLRLLL
jgi:hypothetical protein